MNAQIKSDYADGCFTQVVCQSCQKEVTADLRNVIWNTSNKPELADCPHCKQPMTTITEGGATVVHSTLPNKGEAQLVRDMPYEMQIFEPAFLIEYQDSSWGWYILGGNRIDQKIGLLDAQAMANNGDG